MAHPEDFCTTILSTISLREQILKSIVLSHRILHKHLELQGSPIKEINNKNAYGN